MPLQLGISTLGYDAPNISDAFALARDASCHALLLHGQLGSESPMFPCPPEQLKALAQPPVWGARINLPAIPTGELKSHPAYAQALAAAIAYCASANIKRLVLPLPADLTPSHGQAARELDKLAILLQSHNISLVLANDRFHPGHRTFWSLFNAMDQHIGLLLDTALATLAGDLPAQAVSTLNNHLAGVILTDVEKGGPARYMPLGQGEARIHEYVRRLMGIGSDAALFLEFIPGSMNALGPAPDYLKAGAQQIAQAIKKVSDDIAAAKAPPVKAKPVPGAHAAAKPAVGAPGAKPVPAAAPKPIPKPPAAKPAPDQPPSAAASAPSEKTTSTPPPPPQPASTPPAPAPAAKAPDAPTPPTA